MFVFQFDFFSFFTDFEEIEAEKKLEWNIERVETVSGIVVVVDSIQKFELGTLN